MHEKNPLDERVFLFFPHETSSITRVCVRQRTDPGAACADNRVMNWDRIEGNWTQLTGNVKEQWAKLTDDQLLAIGGKRDQLVGRIQEAYGITREETEKQVAAWQRHHVKLLKSGK
jgi:uncharacterized protein YjbJ (UPF0337 family)